MQAPSVLSSTECASAHARLWPLSATLPQTQTAAAWPAPHSPRRACATLGTTVTTAVYAWHVSDPALHRFVMAHATRRRAGSAPVCAQGRAAGWLLAAWRAGRRLLRRALGCQCFAVWRASRAGASACYPVQSWTAQRGLALCAHAPASRPGWPAALQRRYWPPARAFVQGRGSNPMLGRRPVRRLLGRTRAGQGCEARSAPPPHGLWVQQAPQRLPGYSGQGRSRRM